MQQSCVRAVLICHYDQSLIITVNTTLEQPNKIARTDRHYIKHFWVKKNCMLEHTIYTCNTQKCKNDKKGENKREKTSVPWRWQMTNESFISSWSCKPGIRKSTPVNTSLTFIEHPPGSLVVALLNYAKIMTLLVCVFPLRVILFTLAFTGRIMCFDVDTRRRVLRLIRVAGDRRVKRFN